MTVKELIEELQKCNQDCDVDTFDAKSGVISEVLTVDGEHNLVKVYLNVLDSIHTKA
jgi:hypothetical protein